jgi:DNA-binding transcriptional LysR family regulator
MRTAPQSPLRWTCENLVDLRELRYFVALAEEQHFGRAAERLYIAQSGLSRAIRRAEEELGVALFSRTRHHVELTAAGSALLEHSQGVLRNFEEVRTVAEAARDGMVGALSLATSPAARYQVAPPILRRFSDACPNVRLIRREQLTGEIAEDLLAGALDVGIAFCAPAREGLEREPLRDVELRALVPTAHPLAGRGRVAPAELRDERLLVDAEILASGSAASLEPVFAAAGFQPTYAPGAVDHDEDLHGVLHGDGVVLSARTFLGDHPPGVAALGMQPPMLLPLELVRRVGAPSAILARFIELARQVRGEQGWTIARPLPAPLQ